MRLVILARGLMWSFGIFFVGVCHGVRRVWERDFLIFKKVKKMVGFRMGVGGNS